MRLQSELIYIILFKKLTIDTKTIRLDIVEGQRFYELPNEAVKILDIRVKNHKNSSNNYQSIPRSTYEPETEDTDGL